MDQNKTLRPKTASFYRGGYRISEKGRGGGLSVTVKYLNVAIFARTHVTFFFPSL